MKLGFFTMPVHRLGRDYTETLEEDREAVILADRLGYSEAYVGEHLTDAAENITNSMLFQASLVAATRNIKLGTGTTNLSHAHPVVIAAQAAMLDHLLKGRFLFGISPGALESDAEALGIRGLDRREMFAEAIGHIVAIWQGEPPYDLEGKHWKITTSETLFPEVGLGPIVKPYQKPHPPVLGTVVAPHSSTATDMGRMGFLPISANFLMEEWVPTHWANYVEGLRGGGADPGSRPTGGLPVRSSCTTTTGRPSTTAGRTSGAPTASTTGSSSPSSGSSAGTPRSSRRPTSPTRR